MYIIHKQLFYFSKFCKLKMSNTCICLSFFFKKWWYPESNLTNPGSATLDLMHMLSEYSLWRWGKTKYVCGLKKILCAQKIQKIHWNIISRWNKYAARLPDRDSGTITTGDFLISFYTLRNSISVPFMCNFYLMRDIK